MRILVHHIFYRPEPIGNGTYTGEMCEWLVRHQVDVRVVCPPPYYPFWRVQKPYRAWAYRHESIEGVRVTRCPIWVPAQPRGLKRVVHALSFLLFSFPVVLLEALRRPDVVFVIQPSFLNAIACLVAARCCGALAWMHVQDLELDLAFGLGRLCKGSVRRWVRRFETWVLRRFDIVSTISGRMLERLADKGVASERLVLFPNWVDTAALCPNAEPSQLRQELNIPGDAIVALFSGTLGAKQGVEQLIAAAQTLESQSNIQFVICGEGSELSRLRKLATGLPNVRFLPLQPLDRLNDLLNLADLHVLTQNPLAADLVMPSKLLGMAASGRPVIATANPGTEIARVVPNFGVVVKPDNPTSLASAIAQLAADHGHRAELGKRAREFAVRNWSPEAILNTFQARMHQACLSELRGTTSATTITN